MYLKLCDILIAIGCFEFLNNLFPYFVLIHHYWNCCITSQLLKYYFYRCFIEHVVFPRRYSEMVFTKWINGMLPSRNILWTYQYISYMNVLSQIYINWSRNSMFTRTFIKYYFTQNTYIYSPRLKTSTKLWNFAKVEQEA